MGRGRGVFASSYTLTAQRSPGAGSGALGAGEPREACACRSASPPSSRPAPEEDRSSRQVTLGEDRPILYLCMGSACHRLGVYDILPRLQALLAAHDLERRIALKGHFCLNNCSEGVVLKFADRHFGHVRPDNVELVFEQQMLPYILEATR